MAKIVKVVLQTRDGEVEYPVADFHWLYDQGKSTRVEIKDSSVDGGIRIVECTEKFSRIKARIESAKEQQGISLNINVRKSQAASISVPEPKQTKSDAAEKPKAKKKASKPKSAKPKPEKPAEDVPEGATGTQESLDV